MKRIGLWLITLALWAAPAGRAQDAATEQRLAELSGKLEGLIESQQALRAQVAELKREVEGLREQQSKPQPVYAGQDDLQVLKKAIERVDAERIKDNQKIRAELLDLIKAVQSAGTPAARGRSSSSQPPDRTTPEKGGGPENFLKHTVAEGDTLSAIITACREKGLKVTQEQIVRANPGVKPERLKIGSTLLIPLPASYKPPQ